jgi:hypothetical protein
MRRMLILGLACAAGFAAAQEARPENPMRKHGVTLYANNVHEECVHLAVGDSVDYRYKSTSTVIFNIHYHTETDVITAIKKEDVTSDAGSYVATEEHGYCMMWTNAREDSTSLQYEFRINRRAG